jgi:hypothetical protein
MRAARSQCRGTEPEQGATTPAHQPNTIEKAGHHPPEQDMTEARPGPPTVVDWRVSRKAEGESGKRAAADVEASGELALGA